MVRSLAYAALVAGATGCYIQGVDSGVCMDADKFSQVAPFCGDVVQYRACVPKEYTFFPNHTLANKDSWVAGTFQRVKDRRTFIETGIYPDDVQPWEGGGPGVVQRFTNNIDCQEAYRKFLCYMNFPRCDAQQESMMLCRSVCLNYFRACKYPKDMIRCYDPANQGGLTAEDSSLTDPETGLPILLRAPYPGLPFRDNLVIGGQEQPVCTPATGGAGTTVVAAWAAAAVALAAVQLLGLQGAGPS